MINAYARTYARVIRIRNARKEKPVPMVVDVSECIRSMKEKRRSCYQGDGITPKQSYPTKAVARSKIPKHLKIKPYPCELHGWHLGHQR